MTTPKKSFWGTIPGFLTAAGGFVTAAAGLVAALASLGIFGIKGDPPTPPPITAVGAPTQQVTQVADAPRRDAIDLVYRGDDLGCSVAIIVDIGGQTAQPTGSRFTIRNVPEGTQPYAIRGSISCTKAGVCTASGSGALSVVDGGEYYVTWLNTSVGRCDVTLAG